MLAKIVRKNLSCSAVSRVVVTCKREELAYGQEVDRAVGRREAAALVSRTDQVWSENEWGEAKMHNAVMKVRLAR